MFFVKGQHADFDKSKNGIDDWQCWIDISFFFWETGSGSKLNDAHSEIAKMSETELAFITPIYSILSIPAFSKSFSDKGLDARKDKTQSETYVRSAVKMSNLVEKRRVNKEQRHLLSGGHNRANKETRNLWTWRTSTPFFAFTSEA